VLSGIAQEQARLAGLVLALQDLISPAAGGPAFGPDTIRGLQSVDLVTQSLNDLARLTRTLADHLAVQRLLPTAARDVGRNAGPDSARDAGTDARTDSGRDMRRDSLRMGGYGPGAATVRQDAGHAATRGAAHAAEPADASAGPAVDIGPLRDVLTLGDLADRILGAAAQSFNEDESDVLWLADLAASARQEGAA
jgi:hypothetical protein